MYSGLEPKALSNAPYLVKVNNCVPKRLLSKWRPRGIRISARGWSGHGAGISHILSIVKAIAISRNFLSQALQRGIHITRRHLTKLMHFYLIVIS
jgi:hypothetical protein